MGYDGHKVPRGLINASPCEAPDFIRKSSPRGTKAKGLQYERDFARAFGGVGIHGQWFHYVARGGSAWCQTDLLWLRQRSVVVFECKLADVRAGRAQLTDLYLPVLGTAYKRPVLGIVVAKSINREPETDLVCSSLTSALMVAATGRIPTLHWLGHDAQPVRPPDYHLAEAREFLIA